MTSLRSRLVRYWKPLVERPWLLIGDLLLIAVLFMVIVTLLPL